MFGIVLAAAVLFADVTPTAAEAPAAAAPAAPPAAPAKAAGMTVDKKSNDYICHSEEVLGTHFKQKVCRSRSQAEDDKSESRQALQRIQGLSQIPRGN
ncbi:hypothetical protein [Phenylobacterium soli]|uniref:hypothetical protein n=1 Tax=Phenylobacterium soli TaxID=2170551 RepID=UPI0018758253|nr:hypothetical protein [Phenylobacterium soli]